MAINPRKTLMLICDVQERFSEYCILLFEVLYWRYLMEIYAKGPPSTALML